jgi:gamma-glutamyltranspeptidase/glutathione hydrolase
MNFSAVEHEFVSTPDGKCSQARGGMVAAAFPQAAQAGAEMLRQGGNAVDAAAAAALCLCVCEPQACGVGGQTMALLHMGGHSFFLDGAGRVPVLANLEEFKADDVKYGYKATSVPTTVAVLGYMVRQYGKLSWFQIVEPAMAVAAEGYQITELQHGLQKRELPYFGKVASGAGARYFLKSPNEPYMAGDKFKQPELAELLKILANDGPEAFYLGEIAQKIERDMQAHGGFLRACDLAKIPWPKVRPPVSSHYRGCNILSGPPPAAGRSLFILLKLLERKPAVYWVQDNPRACWDLARAIRATLVERRVNPMHPDEYRQSLDVGLQDLRALDQLPPSMQPPGDGGGQTTHVSAMDKWGNAVGITQSINLVYGSKAAADGLGFLYNDYLLDCNTTDFSHPNYLRPGGKPASFVVPVIVMHDGKPWLVTGSPGTERILSTVAQFLIHVIDQGLPISKAMQKPRMHYSPEGILSIEAGRFDQKAVEYLRTQAEEFSIRQDRSFYLGAIHAVLRCHSKDEFQGVAEMRRDGAAVGI